MTRARFKRWRQIHVRFTRWLYKIAALMVPTTVQQAFELAMSHHQAGRLQEAEHLYRQVLARQPSHFGALHLMGGIAQQTGRLDLAVDLMRKAVAAEPRSPEAQGNLGNALRDKGLLDEAIAAFRQAIALNPKLPGAYSNLGNALKYKGQLDEAIAAFRQDIALNSNLPGAHSNLGNALRDKGQLDEAIAAFRRAIALNPKLHGVHVNLANALKDKGQLDEAIASYRLAIELTPNQPEVHGNLGDSLKNKGRFDEAAAACQQAIALRPGYAEAYANLGSVLKEKGQLDEAIAVYRRALALRPDYVEAHSCLVFTLLYHPGYDAAAIAEEHQRWDRQHAQPLGKSVAAYLNDHRPDRRLRIGYVSPDFRDHCQSLFTVGLLSHHDHEQFEIFCYSSVIQPDEITQRITACADVWRAVGKLSDAKLAEMIREDRIDILVDLTMHMRQNRLLAFARKPAPVQVAWLAYPGTTGLSAMDYRLTDPYLDPPGDGDQRYVEESIRLPDTFWCYDSLTTEPSVNALPALESRHVTFGCLNNFCKVNDNLLALWAKVLRQVEHSRLLLLAPLGDCRLRTQQRFEKDGVDPQRIEFIPFQTRDKYLETYHRIDLGLDTFPYNGHTTSLDSFWMGVPVVTLVGSTAVSRAGWCQLSNLGLAELAAQTPEEFVRIAVDLAKDLPRLEQLRSTLRPRMEQSPLMDAPTFARNIEAAYRRMWQTWCESGSRNS
jgi:protein O-GlcNAc transferase